MLDFGSEAACNLQRNESLKSSNKSRGVKKSTTLASIMKESESIKNKMETLKYNSTRLHVVSYIPPLVAVFTCRDQSKSTLCFI